MRFDGFRFAAFNRSNTEGILSDRFAFMFCDARALWFPLPREDHAARVKDGRFVSLPLRRTRILGKDTYGFQSDDRDLLGRVWSGATSPSQGLIKLAGPDQQTIEARGTVLFQDREGSFWLGTEGLGLYRFRKREIETLSVAQGLAAPNVYPLYQSTDGAVWIGSWPGGLCRYKGGKVTTFTAANGWSLREVSAIAEDRKGGLWVAAGRRVHRMEKGRFETLDFPGPPSRRVKAIYQDLQGNMWFGSWDGLLRLSPGAVRDAPASEGRWTTFTTEDGLATDYVQVIIAARDGGLWVGGIGGLSHIRNGQIRAWKEEDGLPSNHVRALYEDAEGVLWIGTYDGGIGRFANGRFTKYTVRNGLFDKGAFQILEDGRGNLWVSSNRGIYRLRKRN